MINVSDQRLQLATRAGQIILENGGEVYRVEETATRIATACGARECDSFATQTVIILSMQDPDGRTLSHMRRIQKRTIDLRKVDAINSLSRSLERQCHCGAAISLDEVENELAQIESLPKYPLRWRAIAGALGVAGFALLFGGGVVECLCAAMNGLFVFLTRNALERAGLNDFISNIAAGALSSLLSFVAVSISTAESFGLMTSAVLMLSVPGMALTNAMRDIVAGDLLSGTSRLVEALFIALGLALGSGIVLQILLMAGFQSS
jgi:Uncharacterized conserved protein